jgi:hypothetical protein
VLLVGSVSLGIRFGEGWGSYSVNLVSSLTAFACSLLVVPVIVRMVVGRGRLDLTRAVLADQTYRDCLRIRNQLHGEERHDLFQLVWPDIEAICDRASCLPVGIDGAQLTYLSAMLRVAARPTVDSPMGGTQREQVAHLLERCEAELMAVGAPGPKAPPAIRWVLHDAEKVILWTRIHRWTSVHQAPSRGGAYRAGVARRSQINRYVLLVTNTRVLVLRQSILRRDAWQMVCELSLRIDASVARDFFLRRYTCVLEKDGQVVGKFVLRSRKLGDAVPRLFAELPGPKASSVT